MIDEIKAELQRVLRYSRQILDIQGVASEEGRLALRIEKSVERLLGRDQRRVCPECGHLFRGSGWDGIDSHWRARHESIMPYAEAWPLIKAGVYRRRSGSPAEDLFADDSGAGRVKGE